MWSKQLRLKFQKNNVLFLLLYNHAVSFFPLNVRLTTLFLYALYIHAYTWHTNLLILAFLWLSALPLIKASESFTNIYEHSSDFYEILVFCYPNATGIPGAWSKEILWYVYPLILGGYNSFLKTNAFPWHIFSFL